MIPGTCRLDTLIHLLLAVLCSSSVAVLLRVSGRLGQPRLAVIGVNYLTAVLVSLLLQSGSLAASVAALGSIGPSSFSVTAGGAPIPQRSAAWGLAAGVPLGGVFFMAFLVYQKALRESGLGLSGGFAKMGILLPMVLSMAFWREFPGTLQWVGITTAVSAVALGAFHRTGGRFAPILLLVFLLNGLAEFGGKFYQYHAGAENRDFFLLWVFTVALLCSAIGAVRGRVRISPASVALGVPLGMANYFSSWFLIPALDALNTSVVFSVFGAGTVALLSVTGFVAFGERLSGREVVSLLMVAVSLVLVNL